MILRDLFSWFPNHHLLVVGSAIRALLPAPPAWDLDQDLVANLPVQPPLYGILPAGYWRPVLPVRSSVGPPHRAPPGGADVTDAHGGPVKPVYPPAGAPLFLCESFGPALLRQRPVTRAQLVVHVLQAALLEVRLGGGDLAVVQFVASGFGE